MARDEDIPPQDQQLVLAELERLQQAIQSTREQRERAKAKLATHLTAFDPPTLTVDTFEPLPGLSRNPRELFADESPTWEEPSAPAANRWPLAAGVIVAVVAVLALFLWWPRGSSIETAATPAASAAPQHPDPSPAPVTAPAPVAPAHAVEVVVDTIRPVWMRVTVDGAIALEQELPAGTRLTFGGDTAIVIRAGDAGALRLSVGGEDQGTLGKDGQVVTRRFEK